MDFFADFPTMERQDLRDFKKGIDLAFRNFARTYGDAIESFFEPLLMFLVWLEKLLIGSPWPIIILVMGFLAWHPRPEPRYLRCVALIGFFLPPS